MRIYKYGTYDEYMICNSKYDKYMSSLYEKCHGQYIAGIILYGSYYMGDII